MGNIRELQGELTSVLLFAKLIESQAFELHLFVLLTLENGTNAVK